MRAAVNLPEGVFCSIHKHLFPRRVRNERVSFIFTSISKSDERLDFNYKEWYPVRANEYKFQSRGYVELKDKMRPKIIKKAFDLDASIIEIHSHPYNAHAIFSGSDFEGFREFVPHVWWRLGGKPYAALVFSRSDFDGITWLDNPVTPQPLAELVINNRRLQPNGLSLIRMNEKDEFESL